MDYTFVCPVKTHCGVRALEHIPYELGTFNAFKPMLLCDETTARENRLQLVFDALRSSQITLILAELSSEAVTLSALRKLAALYRDKDCDAILVLGGGDVVDTAKLLNLMVSTGNDDLDAMAGIEAIPDRLKPLAVIPPAAATGFEASGQANLGGLFFRSVHLMPDLLFMDARTVGRPTPEALAEAAFTALSFGAEPFVKPHQNPMSDIYAANAVQMAAGYLQSFANPFQDAKACLSVANAAAMGGCSLGFGPQGIIPVMAQRIARTGRLRVGAAMGLLLPYVIGFGTHHWGWRTRDLLLPLAGIDAFARTPEKQRAPKALDILCSMTNGWFETTQGHFPRTLAEAGFAEDELISMTEGLTGLEHEVTAADCRKILQLAWQGQPYSI